MKQGYFQHGWSWATCLITLALGAILLQLVFLPHSSLSQITSEAFQFGWPGGLGFLGLLLWISFAKGTHASRTQWMTKGLVAFLAYSLLLFSIANYKIHFFEKTGLLPLSLFLLATLTFLLAGYFGKARPLLRVSGTMVLLTAVLSGFGNWLPQVEGGFPTPHIPLNAYSMTPQQLADEGEKIIFGGLGKSEVQGAIGRGQCPLCHGFKQGFYAERAPNLWGITARKRLHETSVEYIAESHVCPDCYIVAGWNCHFGDDIEPHSYMPRIHKPPISLSIEEMMAIQTWLFVREGEIPPSPETIEAAYRKFIPESDIVKKKTPFNPHDDEPPTKNAISKKVLVTGEETIETMFVKTQCINCHRIPGIQLGRRNVGPQLTMKTNAPKRLEDPNYSGTATTAKEYIRESILSPGVYVVGGYEGNVMPHDYGTKMSASALNIMVNYLAEWKDEKNK